MVWLIDLSLLRELALVPNAIARTIGMAAHSPDTLAELTGFLRDREMLLVLDSCEHVIDAVRLRSLRGIACAFRPA